MSKSIARESSASPALKSRLVANLGPAVGFLAFASVSAPHEAFALTVEQARENCRATVGRPIVQACMGGQKGEGPALEACRAKASPSVKACIMAAMNKAHGRANMAISIDDAKKKMDEGLDKLKGLIPGEKDKKK